MRKTINWTLTLLAFVFIFSSCVGKKKYTQLMDEKMSLEESLASARKKVTKLEEDIKTLEEDKAKLAADYAADKEMWDGKMKQMESDLASAKSDLASVEAAAKAKEEKMMSSIKGIFSPYEADGLILTEKNGRIHVSMANPIQYRSGSTRITKEFKETIDAIANVLKENPNLGLLVEGHSDNVPMKEGAKWGSNMELSMARANRVVRSLVKKGANPNQLTAVGRGSSSASDDNAASRRTEFIIIPDLSNAYRIKASGV